MTLDDADTRAEALDASRSFIVQAPAGSGKTELLIQRHLHLLAGVRYPEQVVAVTFTRKAAAEMRARVLEALELAAGDVTDVAEHRRLSVELAAVVLARDRELGWCLLERPARLRIDTVDALNGWLADRLPIGSGGMAGAAVIENPDEIYRRAAIRTLEAALSGDDLREPARLLLQAADNSFEMLVRAAVSVLPMRDQWLGFVGLTDGHSLRDALSAGIKALADTRVRRLRRLLGPTDEGAVAKALRHAAAHVDIATQAGLPGLSVDETAASPESSSFWKLAGAMLLAGSGQWRRRLTRNEGFLPVHKAEKAAVAALIETLSARPGVLEALLAVRALPLPAPTDGQIERARAALKILLQMVAELKLVFQQTGSVDFLELALGAQAALGGVDAPSELLLALDRRIEHLLVDEFQDTSHSQYRLLKLLTAGWTEGDGRTLFLVGDPMQSIYRFRDADMSLFLRAKAEGIGNVRLHHLVLRNNFRSAPAIVDWVNATFAATFPDDDDPAVGRAAYYPFEASRPATTADRVQLHRVPNGALVSQHRVVARLAAEALMARPASSVAVLVQSRTHLRGLREVLDAADIPVRAVELDTLSEQPVVKDLIALTRAMLHGSDRIAWLAVLRAPWCGLDWTDLHALCAGESEREIPEILRDPVARRRLSGDRAVERAQFVADRLARAEALRGRYPLARWIECCWQLLDGPATVRDRHEIDQAQRFFTVLASLAAYGDIPDTAELCTAFDVPYGDKIDNGVQTAAALEIMTIHRAKGLEFDTVILFALEKRVRGSDAKLLYWQSPGQTGAAGAGCLLAGMDMTGDPLARYLQALDRALERDERARLLYVAVTRARSALHLVGALAENDGGDTAPAGTLIAPLLDQFRTAPISELPPEETKPGDDWLVPTLAALGPKPEAPAGPLALAAVDRAAGRREFEWASSVAAHVGTVVHRALQQAGAGADAAESPKLTLDDGAVRSYRRELSLLGVPPAELDAATGRVREILSRVAADTTGAWILARHRHAAAELELAVVQSGRIVHLRIDRTFVDEDGVRWIIDYKTSRHAGGDREAFLATEMDTYRPQLEAYARAMCRLDPRPVRVGLYFPLLGEFRAWTPESSETA